MIMRDNKSKIFFVAGFICLAVLAIIFIKNKPNHTNEVNTCNSQQKSSESKQSSKNDSSLDLDSFKKASERLDSEDVMFAGKDAGFEKFFSYGKPVFVNFTWIECGPCKKMAPFIESTFDKFRGKAIIKDVEVSVSNDFASQAGIRVTPTQIFVPLKEDFKFSEKAKSVIDDYFHEIKVNGKKAFIHEGLLREKDLEILIADMINE
ncbi:co-chaperone YbbN [uncultured Finegoldia sp.]|uniref:thioredoxin family protein n=1 Tax=uncultured Finegoldia sp. TaxID=328009 RepID=UPI0026195946|nr:thioredoxin family protein [uncultured Finegoldia sp.]